MSTENDTAGTETEFVPEINTTGSKVEPESKTIRVRVFDPESGKSCHQCRQKTKNLTATCKVLKEKGFCGLTFCPKCLVNRYGEKIDDVEKADNWICPKCRGCCNCSICMKKKGFQPTGILTSMAKAKGFNSVLDFLDNKGAEVLELQNEEAASSKMSQDNENGDFKLKDGNSIIEGSVKKSSKKLKNNANGLENESKGKAMSPQKVRKLKECTVEEDIVLPASTPLAEVAGLEFAPHDISNALLFMEFCHAFSEALDIKKGQPESILRDLVRGRGTCHGTESALVEFNVKLLSLLKEGINENEDSWLKSLRKCIKESVCEVDDVRIDSLDNGISGYYNLEVSEKLKLLKFLCDEVLSTKELRTTVDNAVEKFNEEVKQNNEKVIAARKKEKELRQIAKDEKVKYMLSNKEGTQASSPERVERMSQLKSEADVARAEVHQSLQLVPKKNQRSDAVRTDPIMRGSNGQIFWKLSCYHDSSRILLQDVGNLDSGTVLNNWSTYNEEEEKIVEKYISSLRNEKRKRHQFKGNEEETTMYDAEEETKVEDVEEESSSDYIEEEKSVDVEGMKLDISEEGKKLDICDEMKLDNVEEEMKLDNVEEEMKLDNEAGETFDYAAKRRKLNDVEEKEKPDSSETSNSGHSPPQDAGGQMEKC